MIKYKSKILKQIRDNLGKGGGLHNSCEAAGISSMTLWRWRKKYPRVDQYIEKLIEHRVQLVEDSLYKNALRGNSAAQIFFLKVFRPAKYAIDKPLIDASKHITVNKKDTIIVQVFNSKEYADRLKELNGKSIAQITELLSESLGVSEAATSSGATE